MKLTATPCFAALQGSALRAGGDSPSETCQPEPPKSQIPAIDDAFGRAPTMQKERGNAAQINVDGKRMLIEAGCTPIDRTTESPPAPSSRPVAAALAGGGLAVYQELAGVSHDALDHQLAQAGTSTGKRSASAYADNPVPFFQSMQKE